MNSTINKINPLTMGKNIGNNRDVFKSLRINYIIGFVVLIIILIVLYIYNPLNLFTTYVGPTMFISLFLGMFLIIMITNYDDFPKGIFLNTLFILGGLIVSTGLIVLLLWLLGLLSSNHSPNSIVSTVINFLLLFVILCIVYKVLVLTKWTNTPLLKAILQTIFYIPCLFVNLIEIILKEYRQTTKPIVVLFCMAILLWILYFVYPIIMKSVYTRGGNQIINQPVPLDNEQVIATYQTLNDTDEFKYQYALSFWFYIDSMPPNTNSSYNKFTNILSYGNNPSISYNASENSLRITVDSNSDNSVSVVDVVHQYEDKITTSIIKGKGDNLTTIETNIDKNIKNVKNIPMLNALDENGNRIIYYKKDVLLQKWNNIILNYSGGTLDVFYNGSLVKSSIEVVPYITYDTLTVGTTNGISGGIANVTYFKEPLTIFKIKSLYDFMKGKNPPSL